MIYSGEYHFGVSTMENGPLWSIWVSQKLVLKTGIDDWELLNFTVNPNFPEYGLQYVWNGLLDRIRFRHPAPDPSHHDIYEKSNFNLNQSRELMDPFVYQYFGVYLEEMSGGVKILEPVSPLAEMSLMNLYTREVEGNG